MQQGSEIIAIGSPITPRLFWVWKDGRDGFDHAVVLHVNRPSANGDGRYVRVQLVRSDGTREWRRCGRWWAYPPFDADVPDITWSTQWASPELRDAAVRIVFKEISEGEAKR